LHPSADLEWPVGVEDAVHQNRVGSVDLDEAERGRLVEWLSVHADVADREGLQRSPWAAFNVGRQLGEASLAEHPRREIRAAAALAPGTQEHPAIAERLEEHLVRDAGGVAVPDRDGAVDRLRRLRSIRMRLWSFRH